MWCGGWRIIPARAGFTTVTPDQSAPNSDHPRSRGVYSGRPTGSRRSRDHPRSRGVYMASRRLISSMMGSSPLARGLLAQEGGLLGGGRIIPARAGFTLLQSMRVMSPWGSSPLARGLPSEKGLFDETTRIIPARAGFTHDLATVGASSPDHPRSRGVYAARKVGAIMADGSSPLARGLRRVWPVPHAGAGIIPARAGFTRRGRPG